MSATEPPADAPLDLLIRHTAIVTGVPGQATITDGAIGIRGNRLAYVGDDRSLQAKEVIDATGHVATPGFVNAHTHAVLCFARGMTEDLGFAPAYTPGVPHFGDVTEGEAEALARLAGLEMLTLGSTTLNDMYAHAHVTLPALAESGMRVSASAWLHDVDFAGVHDRVWKHHAEIGARTLQYGLDLAERWQGAHDGRVSVMLAPHAIDTCSMAFLADVGEASRRTGLRVMTHLAQSTIEAEQIKLRDGLTPTEVAREAGILNDRLIAAHCLVMTEQDIEAAGAARITVAHCPKVNLTGGYMPVTSALRRAGARIALGTDNMHGDLLEVMRWALAAGRVQERAVTEFWQPRDVFAMGTLAAAAALGLEDDIGSLESGKKADLLLFDFDRPHLTPAFEPLRTLIHCGQGRDIARVIVDGRTVVEDGRPIAVDAARIRAEGTSAARSLWTRVTGSDPVGA